MAVDWDGDGQTDAVYVDPNTHTLMLLRSPGNGPVTATSTGISAPATKTFFPSDRNSDGQVDLMYVDSRRPMLSGILLTTALTRRPILPHRSRTASGFTSIPRTFHYPGELHQGHDGHVPGHRLMKPPRTS